MLPSECLEVQILIAVARSDNNARNLVVPMIGMNQIAIRTIGQVFIAKDEINFLARKHFLSLGSRRAGDHIRGRPQKVFLARLPDLRAVRRPA
jgi:hypothetical protein